MNRRGLFGFLGGVLAAGPKLAKGIAENVAEQAPTYFGGGFSGSSLTEVSGDGWRITRMASLKKIISGKDPDARRMEIMNNLYSAENRERVRLDGLRSVSSVNKFRMLQESQPARQRRISKQNAKFELASLLEGN